MSVANPVETWAATLNAGVAVGNSGSMTFTVHLTQGWAIRIPINVLFPTNVSAGPQANVYRSTDGGANFDTVPLAPVGLPRQSGTSAKFSLKLETGQYAVQVMVGGGSTATWTVQVLTQEITTAINMV